VIDYVLPIAIAVAAIIAILVIAASLLKKKGAALDNAGSIERTTQADLMVATGNSGALSIPIELLPASVQIDESSLVEIKDSTVVARITQTLPAVAEATTRTLSSSAANVALQETAKAANIAVQQANEVLSRGDIYRVIISPDKALVKSRSMPGAFRAFSRNSKHITEQANLVPVAPQKASEIVPANIAKTANAANVAANVMNVASLVVGQYYMSIIDSKLETMTKSISKISDFQDHEFKSRILSVIALVSEISQFSVEILESDEQRTIKLTALEGIKAKATELLGQVNISITDLTKKNPGPDLKDYESVVEELKTLVEFQNVLVSVLEEISKLTYLLGKGAVSTEQSYMLYNKYTGLSVQSRTQLGDWHNKQVERLKIDLSKERAAKSGIEAIVSTPLGWINEKHNYKALNKTIAHAITSQADRTIGNTEHPMDVYAEDVELIIKDGKYYYLPMQQTVDAASGYEAVDS
jgi:hypothetical protein